MRWPAKGGVGILRPEVVRRPAASPLRQGPGTKERAPGTGDEACVGLAEEPYPSWDFGRRGRGESSRLPPEVGPGGAASSPTKPGAARANTNHPPLGATAAVGRQPLAVPFRKRRAQLQPRPNRHTPHPATLVPCMTSRLALFLVGTAIEGRFLPVKPVSKLRPEQHRADECWSRPALRSRSLGAPFAVGAEVVAIT